MESFAESADGVVLIANGVDRILRWDGFSSSATVAGVDPPTAALVLSGSGVGAITGTYYAYLRFVDAFGNFSNLSPVSIGAALSAKLQVDYTSVPIPQQSTVVRRQILRNLAGNTDEFFVDIDTTDLGSTSFSSTRTDTDLETQTAVDPALAAVDNGVPPDFKPFLAFHQNRMYLAGVEIYREGSCEVTLGSATVIGRGTEWKATFAGRYFHTSGGNQPYLISSCDPIAQTLTLALNYSGVTNLFAAYAVKPAPAQANAIQWSQALLPESWNATDILTLPEDGDEITGMMNYQSFLYFNKKRHLYRLTTRLNPAQDGLLSLACKRGCLNNRCWVIADEVCYLLDEGGVYAYRGDDAGQPLSTPIQDMFRNDGIEGFKLNLQVSRYFHCVHSPQEEVIRWYVALSSDYLPKHALCLNYKTNKWWLEKLPIDAGASVLGRIGNAAGDATSGIEQYFVGSRSDTVIAPGRVALDGNPVSGTVRGTVTAAATCSLSDANAQFNSDAVGCPVAIADGKGRGQYRIVVALDGIRLKLDRPWLVLPDTTSTYILGGIPWEFRTQRLRWVPKETDAVRFGEIEFVPQTVPNVAKLEWLPDFSLAQYNRYPIDSGIRSGVRATVGQRGQDIALDNKSGYITIRADGRREGMNDSITGRSVRLGLSGVSGEQQARFGTIIISGVIG